MEASVEPAQFSASAPVGTRCNNAHGSPLRVLLCDAISGFGVLEGLAYYRESDALAWGSVLD
jgi:hypothetical protein